MSWSSFKGRVSAAGRSVKDYNSEEELRKALSAATIGDDGSENHADWILPVPDPEAEKQTVDVELRRLLTLQSYLLLDAEKEQAFDRLTEEARQEYGVPTSLISLVDLGRQFLFSNTGNPGDVRETPRSLAFCAHTILNKNGICVVNDTLQDERFRNSKLVTDAPYLRFYAAAPLISPEGYKLGTFCVEGPEPRPEGLTHAEKEKLKQYAAKAMDLMVERRKALKDRLDNNCVSQQLQRHAAVANNLGAILYSEFSDCVNAMRLFQESVQTLMHVEGESQGGTPNTERQEIMVQLLNLLSSEVGTPECRKSLVRNVTLLYPPSDDASKIPSNGTDPSEKILDSIPGLFTPVSKLKNLISSTTLPCLVFGEPFKIDLDAPVAESDADRLGECPFVIPVNQCSKATLFNMGLIHYQWGAPDTAVQFFDLAASLSAKAFPLAFDPVVLGCLNNTAQVHLLYRRPSDAMEMLADALTRGSAALVNMYSEPDRSPCAFQEEEEIRRTRRLRRKLARTVLNMAHVHFFNCDYDASMAACMDALRLMHTDMQEVEVAAVWYDVSMLHYHRGKKLEALQYINKFLDLTGKLNASNLLQIADAKHRKGQILFEMGNLYDCMSPLNEALRIRRLKRGEDHASVAETLCLIGKVLHGREEYDFALNALKQALKIQRKLSDKLEGSPSFEVAETLLEVGRAYHSKGDLEESLKVYLEVAEMTRDFFGDRHAFVARIDNILANLYLENGMIDECLAAFEEATKIRLEQGLPLDLNVGLDKLAGIKRTGVTVAPTA